MTLDGYLPNIPSFNGTEEIAKRDFILVCPGLVEKVEQKNHHQADDKPKSQIFIKGA
jgi:hypothetical protein